ncbi:MAG TPA: 4-carboxy-4-hydroxy-2-oxoadipate aldolase/oxaloacetate decarboxylase, partial [Pantoea sp.]|nr:4-carboxy-4-hydroxy-2-oxoadipate aldolase/oxaloacetate decarboxylase [Pantoea sp.]
MSLVNKKGIVVRNIARADAALVAGFARYGVAT